jgi:hypothetical protein
VRKVSLSALAVLLSAFGVYVAVKSVLNSFEELDIEFGDENEEEPF